MRCRTEAHRSIKNGKKYSWQAATWNTWLSEEKNIFLATLQQTFPEGKNTEPESGGTNIISPLISRFPSSGLDSLSYFPLPSTLKFSYSNPQSTNLSPTHIAKSKTSNEESQFLITPIHAHIHTHTPQTHIGVYAPRWVLIPYCLLEAWMICLNIALENQVLSPSRNDV